MKALGIIHKGLFILFVPILCISMAINWEITTPQVYTYGFDKYDVVRATDLSRFELEDIAKEFVTYFQSSDEYLSTTVMEGGQLVPMFSREELIHFKDVKGLVKLNRNLMYVALGYVALSLIWWRRGRWLELGYVIMAGAGVSLGLLMVLVLGMMLRFDQLFLWFHLLGFSNDFWSAPGYMLKLFPWGFWYDISLFTVLVSSLLALIFGGLGFGLTRYIQKKSASLSKIP